MSKSVRAGLAAALQSRTFADVVVRFRVELSAEEQQERDAATGHGSAAAERLVGDSLPLHRYILALGSTYFEARFQNACWQGSAAAMPCGDLETRDSGEPGEHRVKRRKKHDTHPQSRSRSEGRPEGCGAVVASELPEVMVPLSSEEEVPYAREALNYIYTGSFSADLGFEALLRVRQQACYLGVKDGPQACDEAMVAWLLADKQQQRQRQRQQQQGGSGGTSTSAAALARILDAYACHALFPEPGTSPEAASFASVRAALSRCLGSHFWDVIKTLSKPDSYQQLLQLPAGALEYLLSADNYKADSEDTVLLLLACWLGANKDTEGHGCASLSTRDLRQLVHLERLGRTYLFHVLPAFAPLQLTAVELALLLRYAELGSVEKERSDSYFSFTRDSTRAEARASVRKELLQVDALRQLLAPSSRTPLRQVQDGRTVYWSISGEQLEQGLKHMLDSNEKTWVKASFGESATACGGCSDGTQVLARGLLWGVKLELDPALLLPKACGATDQSAADAPAAAPSSPQADSSTAAVDPETGAWSGAVGVYVTADVPPQLGGGVEGVASEDVRVMVNSWDRGWQAEGWVGWCTLGTYPRLGHASGWPTALQLQPAAAAAEAGAAAAEAGAAAAEAGAGAGAADAGGGGAAQGGGAPAAGLDAAAHLAHWSKWLHERKIWGSVKFH